MNPTNGSCACGSITYQLNTDIKHVVNCHCDLCRAHNGAAFSSYAALPHSDLQILQGEEQLSRYAAHGGVKHFCANCGTPLYNTNEKYPGACMIFLGTLENARNLTPRINVWCESQLPWVNALAEIRHVDQGVESR